MNDCIFHSRKTFDDSVEHSCSCVLIQLHQSCNCQWNDRDGGDICNKIPFLCDLYLIESIDLQSLPCASLTASHHLRLFPYYSIPRGLVRDFEDHCETLSTRPYMLRKKIPGRPYVYPALYRFLYCCGARCGEARHLRCENVHLNDGYLDILQSKGHRDRRLFLSDELISYLKDYDSAIGFCFPEREYFFPGPSGNIISESSVPFNFRKIWLAAGLKRDGKVKPRPYDFRHHFACANIARWSKEGKDVIHVHASLSHALYGTLLA